MKIISISNQKGGAGKSTLTGLIATALAVDYEFNVCVIDTDEQATLTDTRDMDLARLPQDYQPPYPILQVKLTEVPLLLKKFSEQRAYDVVFVDIAGRIDDKDIISLLMLCDGVLIPLLASQPDRLATLTFLELIKDIADDNEQQGVPFTYYALSNMKNAKSREDMLTVNLTIKAGIPVFNSSLRRLEVYKSFNTLYSFISMKSTPYVKLTEDIRQEILSLCDEFIEKFELLPPLDKHTGEPS